MSVLVHTFHVMNITPKVIDKSFGFGSARLVGVPALEEEGYTTVIEVNFSMSQGAVKIYMVPRPGFDVLGDIWYGKIQPGSNIIERFFFRKVILGLNCRNQAHATLTTLSKKLKSVIFLLL